MKYMFFIFKNGRYRRITVRNCFEFGLNIAVFYARKSRLYVQQIQEISGAVEMPFGIKAK